MMMEPNDFAMLNAAHFIVLAKYNSRTDILSYRNAKDNLKRRMAALQTQHATKMNIFGMVQQAWQIRKREKFLHTYGSYAPPIHFRALSVSTSS